MLATKTGTYQLDGTSPSDPAILQCREASTWSQQKKTRHKSESVKEGHNKRLKHRFDGLRLHQQPCHLRSLRRIRRVLVDHHNHRDLLLLDL